MNDDFIKEIVTTLEEIKSCINKIEKSIPAPCEKNCFCNCNNQCTKPRTLADILPEFKKDIGGQR